MNKSTFDWVRRAAAVAVTGTLVVALAGCSTAGGAGTVADSSTLTIAQEADMAPSGFDPIAYSAGQQQMFSAAYNSLLSIQPDGSVGPGLASAWEFNEDGTVLTLTLADGVTFSDESALTADLVVANLERRSDPALQAYSGFAAGGDAEMVSVEAADAGTVVITFAAPQFAVVSTLANVSGMILGQTALDDPTLLKAAPVGSGPYVLDTAKTVKASTYTFVRNEASTETADYPFDTIVFRPILDPQARANALISGQVDAGVMKSSSVDLLESKDIGVAQIGGTMVSMIQFDKNGTSVPEMADERVRQAIQLSIDRDRLVELLHVGDTAQRNALPSASGGWSKDVDALWKRDVKKAKALLTEAGYPNGFSFEILSSPDTQADLEAIQTDLAEAGITLEIRPAASTQEAFDAVKTTAIGVIPLDWSNPVGIMYGVVFGFANSQGGDDEQLRAATGALAGAQTDDARAEALQTLNARLVEAGWLYPLYEPLLNIGYNPKKLNPVEFPGQQSIPLLSAFTPVDKAE
ncbi:ABC transporter substrate-binding protein [Microterricola pindariensis]|uniref:ABC transporter substrate-binding protein n=1 Tax=Microterricola pindariensis TaxID=478010 RepID=UPI001374BA13|nr:ABC transporter substrate-binding protein [Microterricola pindariensis]